MKKIICIFVRSGDHPLVEAIIAKVQGSPFTHAALKIEIEGIPRIAESKSPAFMIRNGSVYDQCNEIDLIPLLVTEEEHEAIVERIFSLTGKLYGINDCIQGGAKDLLGIAKQKEDSLETEKSVNCSAALVYMLRAAFPDFMAGEVAEAATPEAVRQAILKRWG